MTTTLEHANAQQRAAADPKISAFVSASAGSGKTKLLTDRLLRLMLGGTRPERILCLTYTKAAAAEMAIRLNRRLGEWVVKPPAALDASLAALDVPVNAETRALARKLFADVLDLPGGMRIETIHAFCQSLLRKFPLEAELSPHFTLEDEFLAAGRLRESRELVLANPGGRDAIFALAAEADEQGFAALTQTFAAGDNGIEGLLRDVPANQLDEWQRAALGATELDDGNILRGAVTGLDEPRLTRVMLTIADHGPPRAAEAARWRLDWLTGDADRRSTDWPAWRRSYFGKDKANEPSYLIGPKLLRQHPDLGVAILAEQARIEGIEEVRKAAKLFLLNTQLMALARPILRRDADEKSGQASVTYADLIAYTLKLLKKPEDVAWILYKLDGGIDHLLLDEVQDTAPAQWEITDAIAGEFFAGAGARDEKRSIFAVGDAKQSIFSFQGADLESFETYRAKFRGRVKAAGDIWLDGALSVSFRSTAPVLALVDAVFAEGFACAGVCAAGALRHGVSRTGQAGMVTLWPLTQATTPSALTPWTVPKTYESAESAKAALARAIARHIKNQLAAATILPSRGRPATAGDFLILVRQRDEFFTAITRACKAEGVPIAGADRMVLTEQQAVSDLLALCDALLLPEDDLAFGQFLASPLGGLTDESFMALALGRPTTLAAALFARRAEQPDWAAANEMFQALRRRVDYISPHALLAEALGPLGGRARLLERLGPEAAEAVDELLTEALNFAARAPAALQNFVFSLRQSGATIKREAEAGGDVVRIMTVHGAKGLQAPIVILPDTASLPKQDEKLFWLTVPGQTITVPIFCPRTELRSQAVADAAISAKAAQREEYNRLLYVALTRAEDELIICGAEGKKAPPDECWYRAVQAGFSRLDLHPAPEGRLTHEAPQTAAPDREDTRPMHAPAPLPAWAGAPPLWRARPPAPETTRPESLAPSRTADDDVRRAVAASPLGDGLALARAGRDAAMAKGRAVHALLQHLPDVAPDRRRAVARRYLASPGLGLAAAAPAALVNQVLAILENPALAPLFGPGSRAEVPLAGVLGDVEIGGLVDRLAVTANAVLVADYKTDRAPPDTVPPAYARQLAAYAAILQKIFPGLPVRCSLIWTETAAVMPVSAADLARHAPALAQPYEA